MNAWILETLSAIALETVSKTWEVGELLHGWYRDGWGRIKDN